MEFRETGIKGLVEIIPAIFSDKRGVFFESYNKKEFDKNDINADFVQDNHSFSVRGVIRGLHFQRPPYSQAKLVRVVKGKVLDIAVDLRRNSSSFGKHVSVILDSETCNMLYVPEGFAHGFVALEETILNYKCTNFYNKESESGIRYDDPSLNIDWLVQDPIVSDKDLHLKYLEDLVEQAEL